ncbi:hypothetical protein DRE_06620 [Drechslerella stenobrocha 248]|uniref:Uncharacterized protein n=1 Tax=Drechslerella stenobrocha 248 TaxID=1043628 RepID=W7HKV8_9PEZI|nr:hypothetical protein DRE_06620 [Drechslerella stenobrocha 248]
MAICMGARPETRGHGITGDDYSRYPHYEVFDGDFYKCLCEDLAKELDFPGATDLRRISQLQLFGPTWETDPYKKLLLRCLDHSLPRLRVEHPISLPRPRGASMDDDDATAAIFDLGDLDVEAASVPPNPPPSPALYPVDYQPSSGGFKPANILGHPGGNSTTSSSSGISPSYTSMHAMRTDEGQRRIKARGGLPVVDKFHLPSPPDSGDDGDDCDDDNDVDDTDYNGCCGLHAGEIAEARRVERHPQPYVQHRQIASTGLLATVVTGDGSVVCHFKEFS